LTDSQFWLNWKDFQEMQYRVVGNRHANRKISLFQGGPVNLRGAEEKAGLFCPVFRGV
jgi:hypothetical protein